MTSITSFMCSVLLFSRTSELLVKHHKFFLSHVYLAPLLGATLLECNWDLWYQKSIVHHCLHIFLATLMELSTGNGQPQTNNRQAITYTVLARIASLSKNIPGAARSLYRSCLQKRLLISVDFPNPDSPINSNKEQVLRMTTTTNSSHYAIHFSLQRTHTKSNIRLSWIRFLQATQPSCQPINSLKTIYPIFTMHLKFRRKTVAPFLTF